MTMGEEIDPETNQHVQKEQSEKRMQERDAYERRIQRGETPWREHAGVMSVVNAVRDQEFPCSFEQLRAEAGEREVITAKGRGHTLSDLLDIVEARLDPDKDPLLEDWSVPSILDFKGIMLRHWEAVRFEDIPDEQKPHRGGGHPHNARRR